MKRAVAQVAQTDVRFLTVHAVESVMRAAMEGRGPSGPQLLAVTVLTSFGPADIQELGYSCEISELVAVRTRQAMDAGVQGVVTSPLEAAAVRRMVGPGKIIVTPGVRSAGSTRGDQRRVATPPEALRAGADYLVMGRPPSRICQAPNLTVFHDDANPLTDRLQFCYSRSVSAMKTTPRDPYKILLVDDNRDGLLVRRTLLEELGHVVEIADSGDAALRLLAAGSYDVVVTDHRMPRMDGSELIKRVRAANPNARVILLSGFVEGMGLTEENTGADVVLMKSAHEGPHLLRAVKRLMNAPPKRKPPSAQKGPAKSRVVAR